MQNDDISQQSLHSLSGNPSCVSENGRDFNRMELRSMLCDEQESDEIRNHLEMDELNPPRIKLIQKGPQMVRNVWYVFFKSKM
jgi:hypothetical protein